MQPFPQQTFIALVRSGAVVSGFLLRQHAGGRVTLLLTEPGVAAAGGFLTAQVMFKGKLRVVIELPCLQLTHQTTGETLGDAAGRTLCNEITLFILAVLRAPAVQGFGDEVAGVVILIRDGGIGIFDSTFASLSKWLSG